MSSVAILKEEICPYEQVCGAGIVRELRGEKWKEKFCKRNYQECDHFFPRIMVEIDKT